MQNPDKVLGVIESKAKEPNYKFDRLYRNFYNIEFYKKAYAKIYAKPGNMTAGSDGQTIDGFSLDEVQRVIEAMRNETYQPKPARRTLIDKKNSTKKRPLGMPAVYDKLVQEILRSILETIYETNFSDSSHGFRPDRSCHTALLEVKHNFNGVKWWVEGDIKGFFDNINHHTLIKILKRRIKDEKFLRLIWKFLRAGYVYEKQFHHTYGGTPQGGIVSPILANIYLNELDQFMIRTIDAFNTTKRQRRANSEYKLISERIEQRKRKLRIPTEDELKEYQKQEAQLLEERETYAVSLPKGTIRQEDKTYKNYNKKLYKLRQRIKNLNEEERKKLITEIKELTAQRRKLPAMDIFDPNYKRMRYTRYADDFLIGIIGSKEEATETKQLLTDYLRNELDLELSQEKTLITHNSEKVGFLGYDIFVAKNDDKVSKVNHMGTGEIITRRSLTGQIKLSVPHQNMKDFMIGKGYAKVLDDGRWKEIHRPNLLNNEPLEIVKQCNAEFRGFYQYYKLAFDVREKLLNIHWLFQKSVTKTLAGKYKTQVSKLMKMETEINGKKYKKFYRNGKWGITYTIKKDEPKFLPLMDRNEIQFVKKTFNVEPEINVVPNSGIFYGRTSITERLNANRCEKCGDTGVPFEVHHVKKVK
ncbi:reverse transcriptase/maturase family protein [Cytobacillus sp. S13-E01]|uniref:reverse transcriptase/maturase family protein n=1 Tax=Cytobacillus sp. S13-E01 TaxID=3031326 RepID=UPI0023D855A8|nr:reverse transcriptase/maturase family protein [Cytobacillus sp. S13-E01]MDF0725112.1 reverse transcriptase/maturase family protein [Cytobacillus sp. S13-E01]